jgi:hypothetical protein
MWKLWVAAVAVGIGVFASVVVFGLRAVDSDAEPAPAAAPPPKPQSWAERASAHCVNSLDTVRAKLTGAASGTGTVEASRKTAVRLFVETTEIEGRLVASLRAIPRPTNRAKVDEAVGRLAEQHARDVQVGRRLQRQYDEQLLRRAVQDYEREATRLRRLFRELGATGCASYFNPSSYE